MFAIVVYLMSAAVSVIMSLGFFLVFGVLGVEVLIPLVLPLLFGNSHKTEKSGTF